MDAAPSKSKYVEAGFQHTQVFKTYVSVDKN